MTTPHNDADRQLFSRRRLIHHGLSMSLGLGLLPHHHLASESSWQLAGLGEHVITSLPPNIPITVTIQFTAKTDQAETLVEQLLQALPNARSTPGCRYAQVYFTAENPNQIVLFKGWDSLSAQEKYLQWEQSSGRLDKLLALAAGEPVVEYWEFQAT